MMQLVIDADKFCSAKSEMTILLCPNHTNLGISSEKSVNLQRCSYRQTGKKKEHISSVFIYLNYCIFTQFEDLFGKLQTKTKLTRLNSVFLDLTFY